jgi:hypothetical protein
MGDQDIPQGRLPAAQQWLKNQLASVAPADVGIDYYTFSQALAPLNSVESATANGEATGLADALQGLLAVREMSRLPVW